MTAAQMTTSGMAPSWRPDTSLFGSIQPVSRPQTYEAKTPNYDIDDGDTVASGSERNGDETSLLSPRPLYAPGLPRLSRSSSAGSTSSNRGVLRRIFIDRSNTPSQHLTRPTFPPPSSSTYSPIPPRPLTLFSKLHLFVNQTISLVFSTCFLAGVVSWALSAELAGALPRWIRPIKAKSFPWDDADFWTKNGKISKDPADYARQVGMDIEHQTLETEDGYSLK